MTIGALCKFYRYTPGQVYDLTWRQFVVLIDTMNEANSDAP